MEWNVRVPGHVGHRCVRRPLACFGKAPAPARTTSSARTVKGKTTRQNQQSKSRPPPDSSIQAPARPAGRFYLNFTGFPFPLGPGFQRKTVRREVVRDTVWVFEQTQSLDIFNVFTPVRMTVVKLRDGDLWVHAPVAPTEECIRLLKELGAPVSYIVLPTFAYEHKIFVGPFSRRFPKAQVYITPFQWSFPLDLPPQFFGIFPAGTLVDEDTTTPWAAEIDQKLFLPPSLGVGDKVRFTEMAFFHKPSKTMLVTDAVVYVPDDAPEVVPREALLELAKDGFLSKYISGGLPADEVERIARKGPVEDTPENLRRGWQRMSLLVLYLNPSNLLQHEASFAAISKRLFVGPVVQKLVYSKVPNAVCDWVDRICRDWQFKQIIPAHFSAPVRATPQDFKRAFTFAYEAADRLPQVTKRGFLDDLLNRNTEVVAPSVQFPAADIKALENIDNALLRAGVVYSDAELR